MCRPVDPASAAVAVVAAVVVVAAAVVEVAAAVEAAVVAVAVVAVAVVVVAVAVAVVVAVAVAVMLKEQQEFVVEKGPRPASEAAKYQPEAAEPGKILPEKFEMEKHPV
jgi:hypothetical protein